MIRFRISKPNAVMRCNTSHEITSVKEEIMPFILLFILLVAGSAAYIYFSKNADRYTRHNQKNADSSDVIYLSADTNDKKDNL